MIAKSRGAKCASKQLTRLVRVMVESQTSEKWIRCLNIDILDSYIGLRRSYGHIETALHLLEAVDHSQLEGMQAPQVYDLLIYYLSHLDKVENPRGLLATFRLKLLHHEGLLNPSSERFQKLEDEREKVVQLATSRSFRELVAEGVSQRFLDCVEREFHLAFSSH